MKVIKLYLAEIKNGFLLRIRFHREPLHYRSSFTIVAAIKKNGTFCNLDFLYATIISSL